MDKINIDFEQEIVKVIDAFPSIYTKDDVVSLLNTLQTKVLYETADALSKANAVSIITEEMFQDFSAGVERKLDNYLTNGQNDPVDYSSAEFSIEYNNQLVLENVDFDSTSIVEELSDILLTEFQNIFGELITSKED